MKTYTINELLTSFQKALRAVAPIAAEVGLPYKKPDAYDDWDAMADGLFRGFLLEGIRESNEYNASQRLMLADYGMRQDDYSSLCYVAASWNGKIYPLVELETVSELFDTCSLAECEENGRFKKLIKAPFEQCSFVLSERGATVSASLSWQQTL